MAHMSSAARAALILLVAGSAETGRAQTSGQVQEAITQGAQIEESISRTARANSRPEDQEDAVDGEAGIYVLRRQSIFFVAGSAGLGYSSNPLRTADDVGGSGLVTADMSGGVRTKLAGKIDFSLSADVAGTKYFEAFAPSNTVASGNLTVGVPLGKSPFYLGAAGFGGYNFGDFFKDGIGFYGASAFVSASQPLTRNLLLQGVISGTRQWNEKSENNNKSLSARLSLVTGKGPWSVSVSAAASRIWFDDFYEDVTFVERKDWQYDVGVGFAYRLTERFQLRADAHYVKRDSTFFLASFDSFEGSASVSAIWHF